MIAAKQNQKFPFHFLSAPPTPSAEEKKKGKENFWFLLPRPQGADEARIIGHQGSARNAIELCSIHTARNRNCILKPKWDRREAPTQTHSRQKFPNPKGFSTLRVALSFANTL